MNPLYIHFQKVIYMNDMDMNDMDMNDMDMNDMDMMLSKKYYSIHINSCFVLYQFLDVLFLYMSSDRSG